MWITIEIVRKVVILIMIGNSNKGFGKEYLSSTHKFKENNHIDLQINPCTISNELLKHPKPSLLIQHPRPMITNLSDQSPSEITKINQTIFKNLSFRPLQEEIIISSLSQKDIFVCMPTGGGKSLTFQLPALLSSGITIIIMPLISLIHDQVQRLQSLNIPCGVLSGNQKKSSETNIYTELLSNSSENPLKIIFLTPEKLSKSEKLNNLLGTLYNSNKISRFVIDEAHCVSKWGREFRTDYLKLSCLRKEYPKVPIIALTGTATEQVKKDVTSVLKMRNPQFFTASFNRPNLFYEVKPKTKSILQDIGAYISSKQRNECGLVYCTTKKECTKVAKCLDEEFQIQCGCYHAGLSEKLRKNNQDQWMSGELQVLVATIAFGMGIDKQNVRFVIHHSFPKSLENYYQESGRAGRDNLKSNCIIYFSFTDKCKHDSLIENNKRQELNLNGLYEVMKYCENLYTCKRKIILNYFGEEFDEKRCGDMCDSCLNRRKCMEKDVTSQALEVLKLVEEPPKGVKTLIQISEYLKGNSKRKSDKEIEGNENGYGVLNEFKIEEIRCILRHMVYENVLQENVVKSFKKYKMSKIKLGPCVEQMKKGEISIKITNEISKFPVKVKVSANNEPKTIVVHKLNYSPEAKVLVKAKLVEDTICPLTNSHPNLLENNLKSTEDTVLKDKVLLPKEITSLEFTNCVNEDNGKPACSLREGEGIYGKCISKEVYNDLMSRLDLVRRKLAREENSDYQAILCDRKMAEIARNLGGDAHKEILREILYFKEIYKIQESYRFSVDFDSLKIDTLLLELGQNSSKKIKLSNAMLSQKSSLSR